MARRRPYLRGADREIADGLGERAMIPAGLASPHAVRAFAASLEGGHGGCEAEEGSQEDGGELHSCGGGCVL